MNSAQTINPQEAGTRMIEKNAVLEDGSGYRMELHEIMLGPINLKWGSYYNPCEKVLSFHPDKTTVISHFRMSHSSPTLNETRQGISDNQFVIYQEVPKPYNLYLAPTKEETCSFFEAGMSEALFRLLFNGESDFLSRFSHHTPVHTPSLDFTASMLPKMHAIIQDMRHTSYRGHLKDLYLESKTIELFLLQIAQLDRRESTPQVKLRKHDIAGLHEIKRYIELNFDEPMSIAELSRKAGINQMKLKTGFKQLFNTTVFGYLHFIRMQEARRLLTEEDMHVNEVAFRIGYKHPHHFTVAFKKHFNVTPIQLRK